jgi:Protein of unknown function (DUF5672)
MKILRGRTNPSRIVAVVTPVAGFPLSAEEEISLRHLRQYLGAFDRYIIGPKSLPKEFSDFALKRFPARYFTNVYAYNRLMLSESFYQAFGGYEYILIYQLDCLVFSSNLEEWCRKGWDYVGAPWLKNTENPREGFSGVGNGGLSLRRVSSAIKVLTSRSLVEDSYVLGSKMGERSRRVFERLNSPSLQQIFLDAKRVLHGLGYHNNGRWLSRHAADRAQKSKYHEDHFWSYEAPKIMKQFSVPVPREALKFSFEMAPAYCFAENFRHLPFGCHAWAKYDRQFCGPFLLPAYAGTEDDSS